MVLNGTKDLSAMIERLPRVIRASRDQEDTACVERMALDVGP